MPSCSDSDSVKQLIHCISIQKEEKNVTANKMIPGPIWSAKYKLEARWLHGSPGKQFLSF